MKLLQDLMGGFVLPLLHSDLRLLLQVRGVGRAGLSLHLRVLRQLQLLKAFKLRDSLQKYSKQTLFYMISQSFCLKLKPWNRRKPTLPRWHAESPAAPQKLQISGSKDGRNMNNVSKTKISAGSHESQTGNFQAYRFWARANLSLALILQKTNITKKQ